jgi:hypothetical protein
MTKEGDAFEDIQSDIRGAGGSLGSGGMVDATRELQNVKYTISADGVVLEVPCMGCYARYQFHLAWPEVIAINCQLSPALAFQNAPQYRQHAANWQPATEAGEWTYPSWRCKRCGAEPSFTISSRDCYHYVRQGVSKGVLQPQLAQQIGQLCHQLGGQQVRG